MTDSATELRKSFSLQRRFILTVTITISLILGVGLLWSILFDANMDDVSGSVVLWHALPEDDLQALDNVLADYAKLHPQVNVYHQSFATPDDLLSQYELSVAGGFGPDIFVGDADWILDLSSQGKIRSISDKVDPEFMARFLPASVLAVTVNDTMYGLPLSLSVPALFYNTNIVDQPPETLDALLAQAENGNTVLMSTAFEDSFWGVQAFGGRLFDENGRAILDQGGYANWLDWLTSARTAPGMILDGNRESLQARFLEGDVAYYIGYPEEIETLKEGLGADNLNVAPLPSGPTGSAGPLLDVNALMFSPYSSQKQNAISLDLAQFMTNTEQNAELMRQANHIPANNDVRVNPRLFPQVAGFMSQVRSAISIPHDAKAESWDIVATSYQRVLSGLSTPIDAAAESTAAINERRGLEALPNAGTVCTDLGTVRLVHDWEGADAAVIDEIVRRFKKVCPLVIVDVAYDNLSLTLSRYVQDPAAATSPDLILASQTWLVAALAQEAAFKDITASVSNDQLQRYLPAALSGMRVNNRLIGLPISTQVYILYFNKDLVDDPAQGLDRLRLQADNGLPIALDAQFNPGYWGIGAFGGRLMNAEQTPSLDDGSFEQWLDWLRQSRDNHAMNLVYNSRDAKTQFIDGASAYFVGLLADYPELVAGLGEESLGIGLLPAGPEGDATPLMLTSGFFFNGAMPDKELAIALGFASFATNAENQQLLVEQTLRAPTNSTVNVSEQPNMAIVLQQVRTAYPLPNCTNMNAALRAGDEVYRDVLLNNADPVRAVNEFNELMYETCGISQEDRPTATPTRPPAPTSTPEIEADSTEQAMEGAPSSPEGNAR